MRADTIGISGIIQRDTLLRIPYFQRRYVWEEKDWKRFAMDMESTLESTQKYFLGALILKEEQLTAQDRRSGIGRRFLVVDGQQRLTTLSIYMKVLHMLTNNSDEFAMQYLQKTDLQEPVLTHNCEDMPAFNDIMHLDTLKEIKGANNIFKAYNYFREELKAAREKRGVVLNELLNTIKSSVTFVAIMLNQEDDEQQIFDTINSLGVPLTTGELVKNFLYRAEDEENYKRTWKNVFDVDSENEWWTQDRAKSRQAKDSKTSNIEIFFHAFVRIKMWDFKELLTTEQRKNFVKASNVLSSCKAFVEEFGMTRQELAAEIIEYAKLFRQNFVMDILNEGIPSYSCINRIACIVNASKNNSVIPYILYILRNVDSEAERNKIFGYVETYLIRRMLADSNNKSYSEFFAESLIENRLLTVDVLKKFIESKNDDANLAIPGNEKVKRNIMARNKSVDDTIACLLYYIYESKVRSSEDEKIQGFNDYRAEQFMPKPNKKNYSTWKRATDNESEEERAMLIGTLGNYFLVSESGKKALKATANSAFADKLEVLKKYGGDINCNRTLNDLVSWDEGKINERNMALASVMCKTFEI